MTHVLYDQPIDDSVLEGTVSVTGLPRATALADALRTLVVEHRLRGLITGAYVGTARCQTWEGLDSARQPHASILRMNGGITWVLPAVESTEPDKRDDPDVVMREFCELNPQFTAFEGYVLRDAGDGSATLRAGCWAAAARHSDLIDLIHGHRGVPTGWAYLGVAVRWSPRRACITRSRPTRLDELAISARTRNCLIANGIGSIDELLTCSQAELWRVPGIGHNAAREVDAALGAHGLFLPARGKPPLHPKHRASDQERSEPAAALGLPERMLAKLAAGGVETIGDLVDRTRADLLRFEGIGDSTVSTIRSKLARRGLALEVYERDETLKGLRLDPSATMDALCSAGLLTKGRRKALIGMGIETVADLLCLTERQILDLRGFGPTDVARFRDTLEILGFDLGQGATHE